MRCLVLGHSGTAGFGLDSLAQTWPARLEQLLNNSQPRECTVSAVTLFPVGARAVEWAIARVEQAHPDLVILILNSYPCAVPVVSASVRHRFGKRAERLYRRMEQRHEAQDGEPRDGRAATNEAGRRWARRLLGTRTMANVGEVSGVYMEILERLARHEGIQVLVFVEGFGAQVQHRLPEVRQRLAELHALVRPTADAHRFVWCDATGWLTPDSGSSFWHPDDVHANARGHARYAELLLESLRDKLPMGTW